MFDIIGRGFIWALCTAVLAVISWYLNLNGLGSWDFAAGFLSAIIMSKVIFKKDIF
jgi:hypothetical protein